MLVSGDAKLFAASCSAEVATPAGSKVDGTVVGPSMSGGFSRSVGSGNRWGQKVVLSETVSVSYAGDVTCPENFRFVIECKWGYDIDLHSIFKDGVKELDNFLEQAQKDADRCDRVPMLVYKKDRRPTLAFLPTMELRRVPAAKQFEYILQYGEWSAVALDGLLELSDGFFFDHSTK